MLLGRIPAVLDVQAAWAFLIFFVSVRATCLLRVVEFDQRFAAAQCDDAARAGARTRLALLRGANRTSQSAGTT